MSGFNKAVDVVLLNGGYVSNKTTKKPITHAGFVAAQNKAHYLVTLAARMKGKTFSATKVDDINALSDAVKSELAAETSHEFIAVKAATKGKLSLQLAAEALAFCGDQKDQGEAEALNERMQEFKVLVEFEAEGLFFKKGISKLSNIYTVKEITKAAQTVYAVLQS
tara:strand:+ start:1090 stop:1587 length:498 start_codon:yes stop_codon:yes gene_type:complete